MKNYRIFALLILAMLPVHSLRANGIMTALESDNKIYVVVVVLATIFAGIFTYLVYLDRKITRLEKEKK